MNGIDDALRLILQKLESWGEHLILMLPNMLIAILLLVLTFIIANYVQKGVNKLMSRFMHTPAMTNLVSSIIYIALLLVGFFFVLSILQLDKVVVSLLAGVGIVGLALGFAFQDIAANFISGFIIAIQKPFRVGDMIETNDYFGVIERITLRTIDIRQTTGELVKLPNKMVFEHPVTNYSFYHMRRIDLGVGVSYAEDLEEVQKIVIDALEDVTNRVKDRPIEVTYDEFGDSSINFKARFWVTHSRQVDYILAKSDAIIKIKKAFDQHNIMIPFPIRTLDFNIKGGEKLHEQLSALQNESGQEKEKDK